MKLTDYSIKHSISVFVLIVVLMIGGTITYMGMPREAAPEIEIPVILVTVPYVGVSPEDIESLVTQPLERELKEIKDIDELLSTSAEGAAIVTVKFTTDANLDEALQEVREKVDLAQPKLPKDAEEPVIQAISSADFPMMLINISAGYDLVRLRKVAEDLQDDLEGVAGVLDVRLAGGLEREIQVRVDPARLNHVGISLQTVVNAIRGENINMPGGDIKVGDASFLVRVPGEFTEVAPIGDIVVKMRGSNPVYLRDVAEVVDSFKDQGTASRLDGKNNISLTVTKRPGENIIRIAQEIKDMIAERQPSMPLGTEVVILGDASKDIFQMVKELENNLISGLILVIGVIMIAMGLRNSILVGLAIPFSMLVAFLALGAGGVTLNMIVLFSLILALGMLVDNAIVIVENVYRHAEEGKARFHAAIVGTREVAWPVATSTATTVVAFAPLLFWPGVEGKFMGYLPLTLIVTLTASLFVALVITPVLCATFLKPRQTAATSSCGPLVEDEGNNREDDADAATGIETHSDGTGFVAGFFRLYVGLVKGAIEHRFVTIAIGAVVTVGTFIAFGAAHLGVEFFPSVTPRKIFIDVDTGDGTRLETTDRVVRQIESTLAKESNIAHYVADVGTGGGDAGFVFGQSSVPNMARISVDFVDTEDQKEPVQTTIERIRAALDQLTGARLEMRKEQAGPPSGPPIELLIRGDDFHTLGKLSKEIRGHIQSIEGLVDLQDDYSAGRPELRVEIDRERAAILRAGTGLIAETVRTAINGTKASVLRDGEDEYDITVRLAEDYRDRISDLETLRINVASRTNPDETHLVPLSAVAHIVPAGGTGSIRHKDRERVVTIKANTEGRLTDEVLGDVQKAMESFDVPRGYSIEYAGETKNRDKSQRFLAGAFLVALFGIGLILVTQFNSVFLPATIMLAVTLSLVGVLWGQLITRLPFGVIMTGLGVISLAGIVVNNAIVLIDYIQQLRGRGVERDTALIQAGVVRLRPVLLTAITTVLGLVPMALGVSIDFREMVLQVGGQTADFWKPMSIAVIFGLAIATVLTLVVVPVLYSLFDDFENYLRRLIGAQSTAETALRADKDSNSVKAA